MIPLRATAPQDAPAQGAPPQCTPPQSVPAQGAPALTLRRVGVAARLQPLDLAIAPGRVVGLVGPNGSGKSTLLAAAAGLLDITKGGEVLWGGGRLAAIPLLERGRRAAWVPQEAHFEFGFTVRSVVAQGRFAHGDDEVGVDEALTRLDLTALATRPVDRLSGGERQRVLLARALATRAPLQLWDEPLASLDPRHSLEVLGHARAHANSGGTVLLSLHDLRVAFGLDAIAVLHRGGLRVFGPPTEVLTSALLYEVFGVQARTEPMLNLFLP